MYRILIICGFCICEFANLKIICDSKISSYSAFTIFCRHGHAQNGEKFESLDMHIPRWGRTVNSLLSCFSYHTVNKCHFHDLLVPGFSHFVLLVIWRSVKVLCNVSEIKNAVMYPMDKMCVWDKLCSGVSYSAVDCEFNVNESTVCIKYGVLKQKHT